MAENESSTSPRTDRTAAKIAANGAGKPTMIGMHAILAFAYACLGLWPIGLILLGLAAVYVAALALLEPRLLAMAGSGRGGKALRGMLIVRGVWNAAAPFTVVLAVCLEPSLEVAVTSIFVLLGYFSVDLSRMGGVGSVLYAYATGPLSALAATAAILIAHSASRGGAAWIGLAIGFVLIAAAVAMVWQGTNASLSRMRTMRDKERQLVSELTVANREASAARERLEAVLQGGETGAWEMDLVSGVSTPSSFLTRLLGKPLTLEAMRSGEALDMVHPDDRERLRALYGRLREAPARSEVIEHALYLADGSVGHVRTTAQSFAGSDGRIAKISLSTTNITAQRRQEIELAGMLAQAEAALALRRDLLFALDANAEASGDIVQDTDNLRADHKLDDLRDRLSLVLTEISVRDLTLIRAVETVRQAQRSAEEASLAKSQFLANMSHELRTPLNAIIGYSEIVTEDLSASGQTTSLADIARIHRAGQHLLGLISEILDLSKIEAGKLDIHPEPCDVAAIAREALETVKVMAERQGNSCDLVLEVADTTIVTDPGRLKQCLFNLLSNAAKFTEHGRITLTLSRCMLGESAGFAFAVQDSGIGISEEHLARLFQPFVQVDGSRTRRAGGAGIGLVITKRLAQLLGGDVAVQSAPGVGSVFTLTIRSLAADEDAVWIAA